MSALEDFYNITLTLKRTNFDTQSQAVLFEIPAVMYPADPGQNLVLPLGPGGSEDFRIVTLYDIVTDGLNVYPGMAKPIVGDQLTVVAIAPEAADFEGLWELTADPMVWNGGATNSDQNSRVLKVKQIA
jgi:hypothetical protein